MSESPETNRPKTVSQTSPGQGDTTKGPRVGSVLSNAVDHFVKLVKEVHDSEYGDFKRKVGNYLNHLQKQLAEYPSAVTLINEIRHKVVFNDQPDIEKTRRYVLQTSNKIKG